MKKYLPSTKYLPAIAIVIVVALIVPHVSFAASNAIVSLVKLLGRLITMLFPIAIALGILVFGYNVIKFLTSKNLTDQDIYKAGLLNSLFALFIMFVVIGLITLLAKSIGLEGLGTDIAIADPSGSVIGSGGGSTFRNIALSIATFTSEQFIPILIGGALLLFFGNVVISMTKSDVEAERTNMNRYLRWGIFALFIILTLFGIVGLFTGSLFGIGAVIPQFPTSE